MSASGFLKQGDVTTFRHYIADANGSAAARRAALTGTGASTGGPGQVWICTPDGDVYVKFGTSSVDATGATSAADEWFIPQGTNIIITTRGQTHVSIKAASTIAVHISEVYA